MSTVLRLEGVSVIEGDAQVLTDIDWTIESGQHWVLLGLNGSGKSTLIRLASMYRHPSTGRVEVLGEELGRTDVRKLRTRIGLASAGLADLLRPQLSCLDVVMTAGNAALEPWWHQYGPDDAARAGDLLARVGCAHLAERRFGTLSSGERQRILLARALVPEPGLVLLDEPTAALDLAGREQLVATLDELALDPDMPPIVLVTHHVEEIPPAFGHAMLLTDGFCTGSGPINEVLTSESLSDCFGLAVTLEKRGDRWMAFPSGPIEVGQAAAPAVRGPARSGSHLRPGLSSPAGH
ncbi:MAG: ATP-binding cassette domain-containing protein [Actinomycetia bacterium]|nr:ATP-binding cassette domain-containing protein [Actinomycetes bacterium]